MKNNNCWNCSELIATVGGLHCEEHNIFLHEQTKPADIGHGGNGCEVFKKRPDYSYMESLLNKLERTGL